MFPIAKALLSKEGRRYLMVAEWQTEKGRFREWATVLHDTLFSWKTYQVLDRHFGLVYNIDPDLEDNDMHWRGAIEFGTPLAEATDFTPPMAGDYIEDLDAAAECGGMIAAALYSGLFVAEEALGCSQKGRKERYFLLGPDLLPLVIESRPYYVNIADAMAAAAKIEQGCPRFHFDAEDFGQMKTKEESKLKGGAV